MAFDNIAIHDGRVAGLEQWGHLVLALHGRQILDILDLDAEAILKLASCEMQCKVIDDCLQLFGGYGYTVEYPISRFYTDARIQRIYGGTSEIMRDLVARSILGKA